MLAFDAEWEASDFASLFKLNTPGHWGDDDGGEANILVLRSTNFRKMGGLNYETAAPRKFDQKKLSQKILMTGDIILERSGGSPAQPVGRVNQFDAEGAYSASNFMQILRPDDAVDSHFAFYLLDDFYRRGGTENLQRATTGIRNLDFNAFLQTPVMLPPLDEQRRIAEVLRSVDETIAIDGECIASLISLRDALLQKHFHRADWEPERPLPTGWTLTLLDNVVTRGSGHTPNKKISAYWGGEIRWVSLQDTKRLDKLYIHETAERITLEGIANSSAVLHPEGTVVLSRDATVGRSAITSSEMAVSQHFMAYRCGPKLNNLYLYYWLQRMKPIFERIGAGSTIKTIGLPFFKGLKVAFPPMEEQIAVAGEMAELDGLISVQQSIQARSRSLKAAVSDDLLSGRVRVPA